MRTFEDNIEDDENTVYELQPVSASFSRNNICFEDLAAYFHAPLGVVSKHLGIGGTVLKKICRKNGIPRWPHRKLRSIDRTLSILEAKQITNPNSKTAKTIQSLKESKEQILTCPVKPASGASTKKPSKLTFMVWDPTGFSKLPAETNQLNEDFESPQGSPQSEYSPSFSSDCSDEEICINTKPVPIEPNLSMKPTSYGLVCSWMIPSYERSKGTLPISAI